MSRFLRTKDTTERARSLRRVVSRSEARLWHYLRGSQLGVAFRRQHPIGPYFADYYCAEIGLVVEVDGDQHRPDYDAHRDAYMKTTGLQVLRFGAEDARNETERVVEAILNAIVARRLEIKSQAYDPLPTSPFQGEEK